MRRYCEGLANRLLHCGISVASADGFMAEMGHQQKGSKLAFLVCFFRRKRTLTGFRPGAPSIKARSNVARNAALAPSRLSYTGQ
jgi:hypothetical protein